MVKKKKLMESKKEKESEIENHFSEAENDEMQEKRNYYNK